MFIRITSDTTQSASKATDKFGNQYFKNMDAAIASEAVPRIPDMYITHPNRYPANFPKNCSV